MLPPKGEQASCKILCFYDKLCRVFSVALCFWIYYWDLIYIFICIVVIIMILLVNVVWIKGKLYVYSYLIQVCENSYNVSVIWSLLLSTQKICIKAHALGNSVLLWWLLSVKEILRIVSSSLVCLLCEIFLYVQYTCIHTCTTLNWIIDVLFLPFKSLTFYATVLKGSWVIM